MSGPDSTAPITDVTVDDRYRTISIASHSPLTLQHAAGLTAAAIALGVPPDARIDRMTVQFHHNSGRDTWEMFLEWSPPGLRGRT